MAATTPKVLQCPQQLQVSADGLALSFRSSFIGSGNSLYNSTSVSWNEMIQSHEIISPPAVLRTQNGISRFRLWPVWERCVQWSGRPAPHWSPPWRWFRNMGCCSCSDTRPVLVWLLPETQRSRGYGNHTGCYWFQPIWTHLSVLQVNLIAQNHKWEVLWISRAGLDQEFIPPAVQSLEGVWCRNIKHQDAAVSSTIESHT